jgi:hypothetical protein
LAVEGLSLWSEASFLSIGSRGSLASIGSMGSAFSVGSGGIGRVGVLDRLARIVVARSRRRAW